MSPDQGLADLAYFANKTSADLSRLYNIPTRRFIVVGGSYPGAMSAWFRYKYPHIAIGSLASSAVVEAIADYKDYDNHVYDALMLSGKGCVERVQNNTKYIMGEINKGNFKQIIEKFEYEDTTINVGDFYYFLADISAGAVQGSRRKAWCDEIMAIPWDPKDSYTTFFVQDAKKNGMSLSDYDS